MAKGKAKNYWQRGGQRWAVKTHNRTSQYMTRGTLSSGRHH